MKYVLLKFSSEISALLKVLKTMHLSREGKKNIIPYYFVPIWIIWPVEYRERPDAILILLSKCYNFYVHMNKCISPKYSGLTCNLIHDQMSMAKDLIAIK